MDFIFVDDEAKLYQTFTGDAERKKLIEANVKKLKVFFPNIRLYYIPSFINPKNELDYENNQGIYEKSISEFNQRGGEILSAWNPNWNSK